MFTWIELLVKLSNTKNSFINWYSDELSKGMKLGKQKKL
jgi:hypothetical protein